MRMGVLHYLPVCLLLALVHQAANCSMLTSPIGLLLLDGVAVTSTTILLYKHALSKWDQMPHPTWEGFPIFWREGPEHAAAAFSEWLKHLRWELEWQWGKAMEVTERRYADLQSFEGSAAAATSDDFRSQPPPHANSLLDSIPEEPQDHDHHLQSVDEPPSSGATCPTAPPHPPKGAGATLPEALPQEHATEDAVKDEVPSTTAEDNADALGPSLPTPAAPALENEEVATSNNVQEKMPSAIQHHAPSTPLTTPPAAAVQEEPATAASFAGSDSFTNWMNCNVAADLDDMLFGRLRIPIMAQAGAVPIVFFSFPILTAVEKKSSAAATDDAGADDAIADGLAVNESDGAATNNDGNAAAAEMPVHDSSSTLHHTQTTPTCQGSTSEGPTTPPATPRMTPMASLRRSASSLKEKMIGVKASFRSKRGADVTPNQDRGAFRPHTGCFTGVHNRSRSVRAAAATLKCKLTPNRTNRGERHAFLNAV